MNRDDLTLAGEILKAHGINGELILMLSIPVTIEDLSFIFVEIEGLPVPFRVTEITPLDEDTCYLFLEGIDSREKAVMYNGYNVFIENNLVRPVDTGYPVLTGYHFQDQTSGKRGTVLRGIEIPENPLVEVSLGEHTYLIPLHQELIVSFDHKSRMVILALPEGIFDQ
jgi:16S rRNA processing protein RimM